MTKTNVDIERFIELRARGLSLDKIAQETGTSKPVLLKWSKDFQRELDEAQYFELQDLLSQYGIMRRGRVEVISEITSGFVRVEVKDAIGQVVRALNGQTLEPGLDA